MNRAFYIILGSLLAVGITGFSVVDTSFTQRDVRDPRQLAPKLDAIAAVVNAVPVLDLSAVDGEDGTSAITLQVTDQNGTDLSNRYLVRAWLADSANAAPSATNKTAFSVDTGVEVEEVTAQADYRILTDATGTAVCTLTASNGTYHVMAEVNGKVGSASITVTGN